jgi:hypothetical protein
MSEKTKFVYTVMPVLGRAEAKIAGRRFAEMTLVRGVVVSAGGIDTVVFKCPTTGTTKACSGYLDDGKTVPVVWHTDPADAILCYRSEREDHIRWQTENVIHQSARMKEQAEGMK